MFGEKHILFLLNMQQKIIGINLQNVFNFILSKYTLFLEMKTF